ncbi:MAG: FecR domain-containing protein [Xanthomonadaceae bacterium]|jgi:hypothetical protein|nr:FecR domain-containing protein [Xanthomonadaceae bacterium]
MHLLKRVIENADPQAELGRDMVLITGLFHWKHQRLLVLLAVLLMVCMPANAQDWVYRIRPGDTLWDLTAEFAKPEVQWQRLQHYNNINDPYLLTPGTTLRFPLAWLRIQPASAKITALHGTATVTYSDGASADAVSGMDLSIGATIQTAADASLTLEFADGSRLTLHENSTLSLNRLSLYGKQGMADTHLRLQRGRASNDIKPTRGSAGFTIDTPRASSAVRGTRFRVEATDSLSHTEVLEGQIVVTAKARSATVNHGYGITVVDGNAIRPSDVTRLLPAPDPRTLVVSGESVRLHATWSPVAAASEYRILVSSAHDFSDLLVDATSTMPALTLPVLANGDFWISVRAVNEQGLEGYDAVLPFHVDLDPPPPFVITPVKDSIVYDQQPTFRWSEPENVRRYHFELAAHPDFDDPIIVMDNLPSSHFKPSHPLPPGHYYWRIRSRDTDGKYGPYSEPIGFELNLLATPGKIQADPYKSKSHPITLRWHGGTSDQYYRVQLSRHADSRTIKLDQVVQEPEITIPALSSGSWHIRVQSLSPDGHEGPISPVQTLRLPCRICHIAAGSGALLILLTL